MTETAFQTATELAQSLRAGKLSSVELLDYFIARIEKYDGDINAVVVRDFERAREAARQADEERANGRASGALHGLPMTIKESYDIEGLPTTWGFTEFKENIASSDSDAVRKYKEAGAIFMGKTNVPVGLGDLQSYNPIYGMTGNPWNLERTPGGSSGGSSAALAAGLTSLEAGSDIGGSIRNPAHFCGVYGHKPTWRIVPMQGHWLPGAVASSDLSVCGPLARSAEDLELALGIMSGPQPLDEPGWQLNLPKSRRNSISEYRVAIWPTDDLCPVDSEVAARVSEIGETLRKLGATVSETARPQIDFRREHETYLQLLMGVIGASFPSEQWHEMKAGVDASDPADRSNAINSARGAVASHRQWLAQNNQREHLRYAWRDFFTDWDILICPQTSTPAFPHDHKPFPARTLNVNGVDQDYLDQLFWAGVVTATFLPSTVFPTGLSSEGLPIGLQAVSGEYQDYTTIEFAKLMANEIGGFRAPETYPDV